MSSNYLRQFIFHLKRWNLSCRICVKYKNYKTKIKIICPEHGIFEQSPNIHIASKYGCFLCSEIIRHKNKKLITEEFIEKAKEIHGDKYDYNLIDYKNAKEKVKIICPKHGAFETNPFNFLNKHGCPKCSSSIGENEIRIILKQNNIVFEEQKRFQDLKDKLPLSYDFYIPEKNLLIEYNGIQHYEIIDFFGGEKQLRLQRHHDWIKRKYAKDHNMNVVIIRYDDVIKTKLKESGII